MGRQAIECEDRLDDNGKPAGGSVQGTGIDILWQAGPLGRGEKRVDPNGAFVEDVIASALHRLEWYETACDGAFCCNENVMAISHLKQALEVLDIRTRRREEAGIEGTHAEEANA